MSVVVKVKELILPLCNYSQCILDKSDDNQESPDSWEVPVRVTKLVNEICKELFESWSSYNISTIA